MSQLIFCIPPSLDSMQPHSDVTNSSSVEKEEKFNTKSVDTSCEDEPKMFQTRNKGKTTTYTCICKHFPFLIILWIDMIKFPKHLYSN